MASFLLITVGTFAQSNGVLREVYYNIGGNAVANLTSAPNYPSRPDEEFIESAFEAPSNFADNYGQRPFVLVTFVFFTLFPLFLLHSQTIAWLAAAFVIRGLKEFGEPARKALIIQHSAGPNQGEAIGAYYLMRDLIVTPGALLGAWLWEAGPRANFWGAFICGLAGTVYYVFRLQRRAS